MRRQLVLAALLGLAILTVGTSATLAARGSGNVLYVFNGRHDGGRREQPDDRRRRERRQRKPR